ncbi:MAG: hypothetical protein JWO02_121 [Solirubrobacterales bacterium]|nr:hypothetical protein [Solirubrobacterales bacterium]
MIDPFDVLRDRLVGAAAATDDARTGARRRRSRSRLRLLSLVAGAVLVTGSATAAVVSITSSSEKSKPLQGTALGVLARPVAYEVQFSPEIGAGDIGWCAGVTLRGVASGRGCGPAAADGALQIAGGGLGSTSASGLSVGYAVVAARVAALQLPGGRRVRARPDRRLPSGWKAVVWFERRFETTPPVLLDAAGRRLVDAASRRAGTRAAGTRALASLSVDPEQPPRRPCTIQVPRAAGLHALSENVLPRLPDREPDAAGRPFLSCASTVVYLHARRYRAAILLDAKQPGARANDLPGQVSVGGGTVHAFGSLSGRRVGPGRLVVFGTSPDDRDALLRLLTPGAHLP